MATDFDATTYPIISTSFCERPAWSINVVCRLQLLLACLDLAGGTVIWRYVGLRVWSEFWRGLENMEVGRCCLWRRGSAPTPQLPAPLPSLVQSCRSCCFTSQRWYRRNFGGKAAKEMFSKQLSNVNVGGRSWNWHWLCSQVVPN